MCMCTCIWRSGVVVQGLELSFHLVGFGKSVQAVRPGGRSHYPLSHVTGSKLAFLINNFKWYKSVPAASSVLNC